eukprot:TRINITY_DN1942_c0_g1_i1.p1 TRINITY_DN1942_c0_g1~~TRINITY_DN1942_c0_g1_i1.p1  ORF type:complete len:594 (+),score=199.23 TRINITY_DN1942_c0_g1_i1:26-1807(+)
MTSTESKVVESKQSTKKEVTSVLLDGSHLTPDLLVDIGQRQDISLDLTERSWKAVAAGRAVVDQLVDSGQVAYGVSTGFGIFENKVQTSDKLTQLQENLIRSHSVGVGEPLALAQVRMLMTLRINVLAKGHSGVRTETLKKYLAALNKNCLPYVPSQGSVGASGDLAPLAHLALGLMGEGKMWNPTDLKYAPAADVLKAHDLTPISLKAKEGLALINGTQFIASLGSLALSRARKLAHQADIIAALTMEVLRGNPSPLYHGIHDIRPHKGQKQSATMIRSLLLSTTDKTKESELAQDAISKKKRHLQDCYSLRCTPQVHGVAHDMLAFCSQVLTTEINSATDNPIVFVGEKDDPVCLRSAVTLQATSSSSSSTSSTSSSSSSSSSSSNSKEAPKEEKSKGFLVSGGNFHGQYPAAACDMLAIATHNLANISERRIERMLNDTLNNGLPSCLIATETGLNSGFMIAQYTAAAVTSEDKVLCHPSSCDTIPVSSGQEDHVSMGPYAARKALSVVENVETVLAIELLCACQALDLLRPLKTSAQLEAVHAAVRKHIAMVKSDRFMNPDIEKAKQLLREGAILGAVMPYLDASVFSA